MRRSAEDTWPAFFRLWHTKRDPRPPAPSPPAFYPPPVSTNPIGLDSGRRPLCREVCCLRRRDCLYRPRPWGGEIVTSDLAPLRPAPPFPQPGPPRHPFAVSPTFSSTSDCQQMCYSCGEVRPRPRPGLPLPTLVANSTVLL